MQHQPPKPNDTTGTDPDDRADAAYFASVDRKRVQMLSPVAAERLWRREASARELMIHGTETLGLVTVVRRGLVPVALYAMRLVADRDGLVLPEFVKRACKDAEDQVHCYGRKHDGEKHERWKFHLRALPQQKMWHDLAVALDEPADTFQRMPLRMGGPLVLARTANLKLAEAINLMA